MAAVACCMTACCFGRRRCCSAARSGWSSRCRSVCCASPASGVPTGWSSWTIANSTATPSRLSRAQSASCATPCPSPDGLSGLGARRSASCRFCSSSHRPLRCRWQPALPGPFRRSRRPREAPSQVQAHRWRWARPLTPAWKASVRGRQRPRLAPTTPGNRPEGLDPAGCRLPV